MNTLVISSTQSLLRTYFSDKISAIECNRERFWRELDFYKINEKDKTVIIYAVTDHRQDYMKILNDM